LNVSVGDICSIVVTYHPTQQTEASIRKILEQGSAVVVVDNGSRAEELLPLKTFENVTCFHLLKNDENLGIAEALNQGIHWASEQNFSWVALFDQDSEITERYFSMMTHTWEAHPHRDRVVSLHPRYKEAESNAEPIVIRASDGGPMVSITSGSLMPIWIFDRIGFFASDYFIDEVDTEFCLRIRNAGYLLADSRDATLMHAVGAPKSASILGFRFRPTHHSPIRRYYMTRNRIATFRKYFFSFPVWMLRSMYVGLKDTAKSLIGEADRGRKLRAVVLGSWDGWTGKTGKTNRM
jgi:rhamnosyltransferase